MSSTLYYGLSLTERLNKAGLTTLFSEAVKAKDARCMSSLLQSIGYSNESADATSKTFLDNPESFHT